MKCEIIEEKMDILKEAVMLLKPWRSSLVLLQGPRVLWLCLNIWKCEVVSYSRPYVIQSWSRTYHSSGEVLCLSWAVTSRRS